MIVYDANESWGTYIKSAKSEGSILMGHLRAARVVVLPLAQV